MGKQSAFDPGLIVVVAVLIALPIAIVYLVVAATSTAPEDDVVADPPGVRRAIPEPEPGLVRRGTREKLERELEVAKDKLEQARLQRVQDPVGSWDEIIAEAEREIAQLKQQLEELGR